VQENRLKYMVELNEASNTSIVEGLHLLTTINHIIH